MITSSPCLVFILYLSAFTPYFFGYRRCRHSARTSPSSNPPSYKGRSRCTCCSSQLFLIWFHLLSNFYTTPIIVGRLSLRLLSIFFSSDRNFSSGTFSRRSAEGKSSLAAGCFWPTSKSLMRQLVMTSRQSIPNDQTSASRPAVFPYRT